MEQICKTKETGDRNQEFIVYIKAKRDKINKEKENTKG